jgi:hypothetical protein
LKAHPILCPDEAIFAAWGAKFATTDKEIIAGIFSHFQKVE